MKYNRKSCALEFKTEIEEQLNVRVEEDGDIFMTKWLFDNIVTIQFSDESFLRFMYASVVSLADNKILIMTEHCGYHVFAVCDEDQLQVTKQQGIEVLANESVT